MLLEGKRIIVTGGSRGIGKAIVEEVLAQGASVCSINRSPSPHMEELQKLADQHKTALHWVYADVSEEKSITQATQEAIKLLDGVDVLINNAGITRDGLLFAMKQEAWDGVIQTNLSSAFYTCKIVARAMARQRSGSIINMTSVVGIMGNGGQANYCASKAGLIGLTKSIAREVGSRGVRVNAIAPGFIQTDMTDVLDDSVKEGLEKNIPLQRVGSAKEVAKTALFLASDMSTYITGQVIQVDGGMRT